jgi:hypothetical protein
LLGLRGTGAAQLEVRLLVAQMLEQVRSTGKFDATIAAWAKAGVFDEDYLRKQLLKAMPSD